MQPKVFCFLSVSLNIATILEQGSLRRLQMEAYTAGLKVSALNIKWNFGMRPAICVIGINRLRRSQNTLSV